MAHSTSTQVPISGAQRPFPLGLMLGGFTILGLFLASVVAWSALAPLEGAVVSPGVVGVSSHRKTIQHLEGGIIRSIKVSDGDPVTRGQVLIELQNINASTDLRRLNGRLAEIVAVLARLEAEREGDDAITYPPSLLERADNPGIQSLLEGQASILESNRGLMRDQLAVFEKKIDQSQAEINGLKDRIANKRRQLRLVRSELETVKVAVAKSLVPKAKELQLQQRYTQVNGELIGLQSDMGRLEQKVLETRVQQNEARARRVGTVFEQVRTYEAERFEVEQQIIKASDVLKRTQIVSPIDGTIVNLQVHSLDGVVKAGQALMEIVPANDELIVDAYIAPEDIDEVAVGMPADVRLTAVSRRQRIPMQGVVSRLSADRLTDPQTGLEYFNARVTLPVSGLDPTKLAMVPGMGADVFIRTGARTPFDYLMTPIVDSLQFALREN